MGKLRNHKRIALWLGIVLVVSLVIGCAGIEPYEPHDYRREGPKRGLFTGSKGEFVIFRKADEPKTDSEVGKGADETADSEQQKTCSEKREKKTGTKSGEQQP